DRPRAGVGRDVDAVCRERALPALDVEDFIPAVEPRAFAPDVFDYIGEPAISPSKHALDERDAAVVMLEPEVAIAQRAAQDLLLALDLVEWILRAPLERCVGLGHVRAHADRDLGFVADQVAADPQHALAGIDDAAYIVVVFGRQTDHEVELELVPA